MQETKTKVLLRLFRLKDKKNYLYQQKYMPNVDKQEWIEKINIALDEVRPHLAVDGGNVEVVDVSETFEVLVKWSGNCEVCNMSAMTLRAGIEQTLKNKYPQVQSVKAVNGVLS